MNSRKIEIVANDGSPLGITAKTIYGDKYQIGVGGAELAIMTLCEEWVKLGHEVIFYNSPRELGVSSFQQKHIKEYRVSSPHDVVIAYRSPNINIVPTNANKRIWFSTDQETVGDFKDFASYVDNIVGISEFHASYFRNRYGIDNIRVVDIPIRTYEYETPVSKIHNRFIFTSVPDRGLDSLWRMWKLIRREIPDASLVITSDYRLWGAGNPMNERFRVRWAALDGFTFLGAVDRRRLIQEQLQAELFVYPCTYEELFCLALAEAQVAGAYPITTKIGALETTNMGTLVNWNANDPRGDREFVRVIQETINDRDEFERRRLAITKLAKERFDPKQIAEYWVEEIFK